MIYKNLEAGDLTRLSHYYGLRAQKSCDGSPLVSYLYKYYYEVRYCELDDALLLSYHGEDGSVYGFLPFCREEDMAKYFKLQEEYFNKTLGIPLVISSADEEGVNILKEAGALNAYEAVREDDLRDYIYSGNDLRTLAGRKYSKKRNHINKFLSEYEGRWEYRSLRFEDHEDIERFLNGWMKQKRLQDQGTGTSEEGEAFDPQEELDGEYRGIKGIINEEAVYDYMKIGGIYIDGELKAFSIGVMSEACSMAIIDVEKADGSIDGLYQMINKEFLLHEFPETELVNREDDVGIEGLRQSKLSYYPVDFEYKYTLRQTDFSKRD